MYVSPRMGGGVRNRCHYKHFSNLVQIKWKWVIYFFHIQYYFVLVYNINISWFFIIFKVHL